MPAPDHKNNQPPENVDEQARRLGVDGQAEEAEEPAQKQKVTPAELTPLDSPLAECSGLEVQVRRDYLGNIHIERSPRIDPVENARIHREGLDVSPEKARTGGDQLRFDPNAKRANSVPD